MTKTITYSFQNLSIGTVALVAGVALMLPTAALGQTVGSLVVTARDMTASANFVRSTPCAPYTLDWDDGTTDVAAPDADTMCIQILDESTVEHEYEEAGTYTVTLTLDDKTYIDEVTVPKAVTQFDIDDVVSVTAEWVDPNQMMADEEYYIYTITLESGEVVEIEVAGFTTMEMRIEQFREGGYTGDVDALLELVEDEAPADPEPVEDKEPTPTIAEQLRAALTVLIERLQQLIAERSA